MLLSTLGASLLGKILAGKGINRARDGVIAKRQVPGFLRSIIKNKDF